jgi:hypothetical protein
MNIDKVLPLLECVDNLYIDTRFVLSFSSHLAFYFWFFPFFSHVGFSFSLHVDFSFSVHMMDNSCFPMLYIVQIYLQ